MSSELTERDIEELKKYSEKKRIIRLVFLILGILFIVLGVILFLSIRSASLVVTFEGFEFDLSFLVGAGVCVLGVFLFSRYWAINQSLLRQSTFFFPKILSKYQNLRETPINKFRFTSFSISRLVAAAIFAGLSVWNFVTFGFGISHENPEGSWMFLGGPSWGYPLGVIQGLLGIFLIVYVILSPSVTTFYESKNLYHIYEMRLLSWWLTEIPKKDVQGVKLNNNRLKGQWIYIFLIIYVIYILQTGFALYDAPYQETNILPNHAVWTGILTLIATIILIIFQHNFIEITTTDKFYELWFDTPFRSKTHIEQIVNMFGLQPKSSSAVDNINEANRNTDKITDEKKQADENSDSEDTEDKDEYVTGTATSFFRVVLGFVLIILGIYSIVNARLFGTPLATLFCVYGFMQICKGLKEDFSGKDNTVVSIKKNERYVCQSKKWFGLFEYTRINNVIMGRDMPTKARFKYTLQNINLFEVIMLIAITFTMVQEWVLQIIMWAPITVDISNIPVQLFELYLIVTLVFFKIRAVDALSVQAESIKHYNIQMEGICKSIDPQKIENLDKRNYFRNLKQMHGWEPVKYFLYKTTGMWRSYKKGTRQRIFFLFVIPGLISLFYWVFYILQFR
jgi:hypothetical protein